MTDLTPAQRLRLAAALSDDGLTLRLDRNSALALARQWERNDEACKAVMALAAEAAHRDTRFHSLTMWMIRAVIIMGLVQSIAAWWLA